MKRTAAVLMMLVLGTAFGLAQARSTNRSVSKGASAKAGQPATAKLPDTAAGKLLGGWLEAFNSGDEQKLTKFIAEHYSESERGGRPPKEQAARELQFRDQTGGGYDLVEVQESKGDQIKAVLRERADMGFMRVVIDADDKNPQIIAKSEFESTGAPASLHIPKVPLKEMTAALDAKLKERTEKDLFSGAVLIAKDGKPVFERSYGMANRETKTPNSMETRFRLGSMPKMFTATAIAQLVQQGKLNYTDRLAQVLPDYPNKEVAQKITVGQLLTHSSGLGDIFGPKFMETKDSLRTLSDYVPLFVDKPLEFEPGTKFRYSNAGFIVLGLIIEKLSGQNYYDYVKQHVFDVAGMKDTGSTPKTEQDEKIAIGYTSRGPNGPGPLRNNFDTLPWRGMSAGGAQSTAGDMLRFANALQGNKLLNAEQTKTIMSPKFPTDSGDQYGYGFFVQKDALGVFKGHGGGAPGMNGELRMYDNGYTVVVLSNLDPPAATKVADYIGEHLRP